MRTCVNEGHNNTALAERWQKLKTRKPINLELVGSAYIESSILAVLSYRYVGPWRGARHQRRTRQVYTLTPTVGRSKKIDAQCSIKITARWYRNKNYSGVLIITLLLNRNFRCRLWHENKATTLYDGTSIGGLLKLHRWAQPKYHRTKARWCHIASRVQQKSLCYYGDHS